MLKTDQVDFVFPVIGFPESQEIRDFDSRYYGFESRHSLTRCGPRTLAYNISLNMELIDSAGRRWFIRSVEITGRADNALRRILSFLRFMAPCWRVDYELEPAAPVTLEYVQDRACACVQAEPAAHFDYPDEANFETTFQEIRATRSISEVYAWLSPLDFDYL